MYILVQITRHPRQYFNLTLQTSKIASNSSQNLVQDHKILVVNSCHSQLSRGLNSLIYQHAWKLRYNTALDTLQQANWMDYWVSCCCVLTVADYDHKFIDFKEQIKKQNLSYKHAHYLMYIKLFDNSQDTRTDIYSAEHA